MDRIQRRAALFCSGAMRRTESTKLMRALGWPSLRSRRCYAKYVMLFKIINGMVPKFLCGSISLKTDNKILRHNKKFVEPQIRLTVYQNSFFPSTLKDWQKLPEKIQNSKSIYHVKYELSGLLNTKCSLDENSLFKFSSGHLGKILNQIVLGLSPLKAQLFLYNIIDNPFCPCCLEEVEDPAHYFLKCGSHTVYRNSMMSELNKFLNVKI